jgi:hypothetical protein
VRYINKISEAALGGKQHWPCVGTRRGRPISIHLHGSASLAPYDGWADDVTCTGAPRHCLTAYTAGAECSQPVCLAPASRHAYRPLVWHQTYRQNIACNCQHICMLACVTDSPLIPPCLRPPLPPSCRRLQGLCVSICHDKPVTDCMHSVTAATFHCSIGSKSSLFYLRPAFGRSWFVTMVLLGP